MRKKTLIFTFLFPLQICAKSKSWTDSAGGKNALLGQILNSDAN